MHKKPATIFTKFRYNVKPLAYDAIIAYSIYMLNYSEVITRLVCDWQERKKLSQSEAAAKIGLSQTGFSRRVRGELSWSLRDIDALTAAGIALPAPASKETSA